MSTPVRPLWCWLLPAIALLAVLASASPAPAADSQPHKPGLIIFKDGFTLQGFIVREEKTIFDSVSGQPVKLQEGFFMVDDVARRIIFNPGQVQKLMEDAAFAPEAGAVLSSQRIDYNFARPMPPIREVLEAGPWDDKWDRIYKYETTDRAITVRQHLSALTPYYARVDFPPWVTGGVLRPQYRCISYYLTRELGAEQVLSLLGQNPKYHESRDLPEDERLTRRLGAIQFLLQVGWYDECAAELDGVERDFPTQKERIDAVRAQVKRLGAMQRVQDLQLARRVGQFEWVQKHLADVPDDGISEKALADVRALRNEVETTAENMQTLRRFLTELPAGVKEAADRNLFTEATQAILSEMNPDNLDRLETFLGQAQQAERQRKAGKPVELGPSELLALAVTGWVMGNTASESKVAAAHRLWDARKFVLACQNAGLGERLQLRDSYLGRKNDIVQLDELVQLIGLLPPPQPEEKIDRVPRLMNGTGSGGKAGSYWLQLPREYSHGRPYPVLLVLHHSDETARNALDRWGELAEKHGYILASVEWAAGFQPVYTYTAQEQAVVLDVLNDLRRHFQVDSDRVFLAGYGTGGDIAYDIGLSHPDLFAGVVPMAGYPGQFPDRYRHNAQYLPFYVVTGDRSGDYVDNKSLFREWVPHGYPALYVRYVGRGLEWFGGELPSIFDWMDRKKRANPLTQLGRMSVGGQVGDEFQTMRATDNHFYWLSTNSIGESFLNEGRTFNNRVLGATLQANRGGNQVTVHTQGLNEVSVWFGLGDGVDFDKPVLVYVNTSLKWNHKVTPSMEVLLDDLCTRGDRQRLYCASIDLKLSR